MFWYEEGTTSYLIVVDIMDFKSNPWCKLQLIVPLCPVKNPFDSII